MCKHTKEIYIIVWIDLFERFWGKTGFKDNRKNRFDENKSGFVFLHSQSTLKNQELIRKHIQGVRGLTIHLMIILPNQPMSNVQKIINFFSGESRLSGLTKYENNIN